MIVIDDQPEITEIVEEYISTKFDIDIDTAQSGQAALELTSENSYDIIITDHHMPGMSGTEVLGSIRTNEGPNKNCPVIFLTAMDKEVLEEIDGKYENVHILNKVVQVQDLLDLIGQYLN
jgi:CheY-like chemotaxis protein